MASPSQASPHKCFCYPPEFAAQSEVTFRLFLETAEKAASELPTALQEMDDRVAAMVKALADDVEHEADFYLRVGKEDLHRVLWDHKKDLDRLMQKLKDEHDKVKSKATYVCTNYNVKHVCKANDALCRIRLRHHMSKFTG